MIKTDVEGAVALIELSDCALLTRHDGAEARALADTVRDLAGNDAIKAIVLTAAGPDFCAESSDAPAPADVFTHWYGDYATASGLYQTLRYCPKVVIVAAQGVCADAGSALVLCADLAVMSDDATIKPPFATIPEASFTLAALSMRLNRAKAWAITETPLSAIEAAALGLINRAVPPSQLIVEARRMAGAASKMPLDGLAISKLMLETYLDSQSVGREFDQARFYAAAMPTGHRAMGDGQ